MKKLITLLIVILIGCNANSFAQGKVSRPTQQQSQTSKPKKSTPKVTVSEPDGYINGHGYVDLGLPSGTKWATCNIGATSPEESGDYFAWGETSTKKYYNKETWIAFGKDNNTLQSMGIIDSSGNLKSSHDVATTKMGSNRRMPTRDEVEELEAKCNLQWCKLNGKVGCKITGPNGNSIFLPAAGSYDPLMGGDRPLGIICEFHCSSSHNGRAHAFYIIDSYDGTCYLHTTEGGGSSGNTIRPISQ